MVINHAMRLQGFRVLNVNFTLWLSLCLLMCTGSLLLVVKTFQHFILLILYYYTNTFKILNVEVLIQPVLLEINTHSFRQSQLTGSRSK